MKGITMNELPSEIITKILRFLDHKTLQNGTLTCKLWRDLIESSCRWSVSSKNVDLHKLWIDFMLTTNRKFQTIILKELEFIVQNKVIEIFQRQGVNVEKLCLVTSQIFSFIEFAELLKCMPNLKHVIIYETSTLCRVSDVPPESDLPNLKELKKLEIVRSDNSILKCFQRGKLATLKILNPSHDCEPLEDFLKSQKALTTLAFRSVYHDRSMLFRTKQLNTTMPFHLTRLSLLDIRLQESTNDYENLVHFLKPQTKSLKQLELGRNFPHFVFEFVFANMKKLNTLSLMMSDVPVDEEFYERLHVNRSINELILLDSANYTNLNLESFRYFLNKLPNVRSLSVLEHCDNNALLAIAQSLNKLNTLATQYLNGDIIDSVHFPNLKALHIKGLRPKIIDWNKFTKINSQLSEIVIEQILDRPYFNSHHIEQITANISLHTLRLGSYFSADKRFYEIIREKCRDLKVLDLHKFCQSNKLEDFSGCNVLRWCDEVKCPEKFTLWNEDDFKSFGSLSVCQVTWLNDEHDIDGIDNLDDAYIDVTLDF